MLRMPAASSLFLMIAGDGLILTPSTIIAVKRGHKPRSLMVTSRGRSGEVSGSRAKLRPFGLTSCAFWPSQARMAQASRARPQTEKASARLVVTSTSKIQSSPLLVTFSMDGPASESKLAIVFAETSVLTYSRSHQTGIFMFIISN